MPEAPRAISQLVETASDSPVHQLYGITEEEIGIVEGHNDGN